jgi:hypothetical protein
MPKTSARGMASSHESGARLRIDRYHQFQEWAMYAMPLSVLEQGKPLFIEFAKSICYWNCPRDGNLDNFGCEAFI